MTDDRGRGIARVVVIIGGGVETDVAGLDFGADWGYIHRMKFILLIIILTVPALAQTPAAIERELIGHLDAMSKYGSYGGEYDDAKLSAASDAFKTSLLKAAKRKDTLSYPFAKLNEKMFIRTSKDGKIRTYSWDLESGGTMHDYEMVVQYVGKGGSVKTWSNKDADESAGAFVHDIFQIASNTGPIYMLVTTFIASTSLHGQTLKTVRIVNGALDMDAKLIRTGEGLTNSVGFAYDFFSVVDRPERPVKLFKFNEARKEFSFPVVIEDEKTQQGRVTNKMIAYRFNGKNFVKVG